MANGKDSQKFFKKNKMQDTNLTMEINQLSSELHGKVNAINKETKTVKKHNLFHDRPIINQGCKYPGDPHARRKGSVDELTTCVSMLVADVRRTKSIGSESKTSKQMSKIKSDRFKDSAMSKTKLGIIAKSPPETDRATKDTVNKTKSNSVSSKIQRMPFVNHLTASPCKRRASVGVVSDHYEAHAQRRGSHGSMQQYVIDDKMGRRGSDSSSSSSSDIFDPDMDRTINRAQSGRRLSLPSVLVPMNISSYVQDNGNIRPGNNALPFHEGPILKHIKTPATLYLRKLKSELEQRKPKTIAQLRANPKTTFQEEIEQDVIEAELHRRAVEIAGTRIRKNDLAQCRYLRRRSEELELSIDEIFEKS